MTDNNQEISHKIATRKLTVKQLELQLKRLEQQQAKAKDKLAKQIEREKDKELKSQARKLRNKKIYDWGGLLHIVWGVEEFDRLADDADLKKVLIGLLVTVKNELAISGYGLTTENKPKWLEYFKNHGRKFLDERNNHG